MTEQISPPPTTERTGKPSPILIVFLIFPLLGILAAAGLAISSLNAPVPTPLPVSLADVSLMNKPAPNFELANLDGGRTRLSSYRGRVVFVNFWATWCEPCQRELPAFAQFADMEEARGAVILAVNMAETPETINAYFEQFGITGLTVLLDTNLDVQGAYNVNQFPTTYVLDPAGVVRYRHLGEMTTFDLMAYVDELSATQPTS
jgi:thiol-disulfide isomerase/thioredoxin